MPEIDNLLEKMADHKIERMEATDSQPIRLITGQREAKGPVVDRERLQALIQEIAPSHLAAQLRGNGDFQFPYQSPFGLFNVGIEQSNGTLQVLVVPISAVPVAPRQQTPLPLGVTPQPANTSPAPNLAPYSPKKAQKRVMHSAIAAGLILLVSVTVGVSKLKNGRQAEQEQLAQVQVQQAQQTQQTKGAYDGYMQEIGKLSDAGVTVNGSGKYQIAVYNDSARLPAVQSLQERIKKDSLLSGSETSGQKAELLKALDTESNWFSSRAQSKVQTANSQAEKDLYQICVSTGDAILQDDGFIAAATALKGQNALVELVKAKNEGTDFSAAAARAFPAGAF